jgi:hypothetical protein
VRLEKKLRRRLSAVYASAVAGGTSWRELLDSFRTQFPKEPQTWVSLVNNLFRIAMLDGVLSNQDDYLIRLTCIHFNFPDQVYMRLRQEWIPAEDTTQTPVPESAPARAVSAKCAEAMILLGCSLNEAPEQIKRKYRKLALLFHPDMLAPEYITADVRTDASNRFLSLQAAYEVVKKELKIE